MSENQHLNYKIFEAPDSIEKGSTRVGFGNGLLMAGDHDRNIVALCADLKESVKMDIFAKEYPERFFEMGVAEQSMPSVASGMAHMGKIPFVGSYAMFNPGRNWEQIRTTICYNNVPVKIVGSHAGVTVGPDGGSHQALEDIALMRSLPRMIVISPCDEKEAWRATIAAAQTNAPVYLRLSRHEAQTVTTDETPFEIGKAQVFFRPDGPAEVGIISTGILMYNAIRAAKELETEGIRVRVMNLATIKPIDTKAIIKLAKETGKIVTVEEHQIHGGMGSAVAEVLAEHWPTKMRFVGIKDVFGQSGTAEELLAHYGLDVAGIKRAVKEIYDIL